MQQIYRRTPMPKCDFNKVAKQLASASALTNHCFEGPKKKPLSSRK